MIAGTKRIQRIISAIGLAFPILSFLCGCANFIFDREVVSSESSPNKFEKIKLDNPHMLPSQLANYSKALRVLETKDEKEEFLQKGKIADQQAQLDDKKLQLTSPLREIASEGDIAIGMSQELVVEAWGEPKDRLFSGRPELRNEKWIYYYDLPGSQGFRTERRIVVFREGLVAGWESN